MEIIGILSVILFVVGYIGITLEHSVGISKSAFALITGGAMWFLVALTKNHDMEHHIMETGYDIFGITIFLLCAMALVEILVHYGLFDWIRARLTQYKLTTKNQFWILTALVFILSGIVDNLTATIIAIQIARKFFWGRNLLVSSVAIVIAANAGGAFSPIGDVTTIMLWVANKFSAGMILAYGFVPSLLLYFVATAMLSRKITPETSVFEKEKTFSLARSQKIIIATALISFTFPIVAKAFHLPPVMGIIFGVGVTWFMVDIFKRISNHTSHLTASIEKLIQKTDLGSITFFIGILLAVAGLNALGVLEYFSHIMYGTGESMARIISGNIGLGIFSSILDNIPLTAIAIKTLMTTDPHLWVLLAISVGTGGSLLAVGSAAGVIAMGMVPELSFKEYFKIGFVPALVSFAVAIAAWGLIFVTFV